MKRTISTAPWQLKVFRTRHNCIQTRKNKKINPSSAHSLFFSCFDSEEKGIVLSLLNQPGRQDTRASSLSGKITFGQQKTTQFKSCSKTRPRSCGLTALPSLHSESPRVIQQRTRAGHVSSSLRLPAHSHTEVSAFTVPVRGGSDPCPKNSWIKMFTVLPTLQLHVPLKAWKQKA